MFPDEEYFMPVTPGGVVRVFTQAGPKPPRKYQPGVLAQQCTQHVCFGRKGRAGLHFARPTVH
jgi:hypothetical protein